MFEECSWKIIHVLIRDFVGYFCFTKFLHSISTHIGDIQPLMANAYKHLKLGTLNIHIQYLFYAGIWSKTAAVINKKYHKIDLNLPW